MIASTKNHPLLEIRGLCCGYTKDQPLISDIDVTLEAGKAIAIIGPNGAGKTTLLRTIAGIIPPLSGQILLLSEDLTRVDVVQRARRLALVAQEDLGEESLTVEELVQLGRTPYLDLWGRLGPEDHRAVNEALEVCRLAELQHRRLDRISGGERQRARIALAIAQSPTLLLLDEPSNHLDLKNRHELFELIASLRQEQELAVLMVLHDLADAYREAEIVLTIARGEIHHIAIDDPRRKEKLAQTFQVPEERIVI